jgi:serine/threonine protein kinase
MNILLDGQMLRDTYEVERFLGEGAFAEVYRVKHRFLGRQAMKVFKRSGMTIDEIEEMLGEAIMLSRIGHPNIVRVFDANVIETKSGYFGYFTMENVPGGSLEKFWHSHGTSFIQIETTIDLIKQVCRGVALAHKQNPPVVHRDIKPQNILVGYEPDGLRARISDFGLAKKVNPLTLLATAAGTPAFKPPEVFSESKSDSCAADVWSIGTTLYLLLTDQLPHKLPEGLGWGTRNLFQDKVIPASKINPEANHALDSIISKSLSQDPKNRYQDASEMLEALTQWKPGKDSIPSDLFHMKSDASKSVLGFHSEPNRDEGEKLADESIKLKREGRLTEAADLMEEAFNKYPSLRERYSHQVRLWRRGISM